LVKLYYLVGLVANPETGGSLKLEGYVSLCSRCRRNLARRRTIVWINDRCHLIDENPGTECGNCEGDIVQQRLAAHVAS